MAELIKVINYSRIEDFVQRFVVLILPNEQMLYFIKSNSQEFCDDPPQSLQKC